MVARNELSSQIGALADHLRAGGEKRLAIADIASVTEVLIGSMEVYFRSVDTKIYSEFRELAAYIDNARSEIATLTPTDIKSSRLPRAGLELDAIVKATENATNGIMEAAEAIMAIGETDIDSYKTAVEAQCMRIFEHCSFQDITGQRISKVVETLQHIEIRINALKDIWGVEDGMAIPQSEDADLLHGPALEGEGIDQTEVDALLQAPAPAPKPAAPARPVPVAAQPKPAPVPATAPRPAPPTPQPVAAKPAPAIKPAAPKPAATAPKPAPAAEPSCEEATQAEIDALFA